MVPGKEEGLVKVVEHIHLHDIIGAAVHNRAREIPVDPYYLHHPSRGEQSRLLMAYMCTLSDSSIVFSSH